MNAPLSELLLKLGMVAFLGGLLGLQVGSFWLGVSAALLLVIVMFLRYYERFNLWLSGGAGKEKPVLNNFWSNIRDQVARFNRQHEMEKAQLLADLDFFKDSFQALESAVIVANKESGIDWANEAAERILGISLQRDRGESLLNLMRAPALVRYIEKGDFDEPLQVASPIDPQRKLELQATVFREEYILVFARDITAYAQLERVRQDFIANVSHELKTPLTVIRGYLELLQDKRTELPLSMQPAFEKMLVQSKRIDNLVNDLLWLSKLESLPQPEAGEPVLLAALLKTLVEEARIAAGDIVISLDFSEASSSRDELPAESSLCINGNYEELRAAFSNLLQNAIKYTPGGGHIDIVCRRRLDQLLVQFKDDGIGIDPVHLPRLTERFYRVDDSRTSETGGTGLGLAIVKHVLMRHNGRLEIWSRPGRGSIFTCVLPASRISLVPPGPESGGTNRTRDGTAQP